MLIDSASEPDRLERCGEHGPSVPTQTPRVAIWGTFDVANFGDLLFPRIFEHEIKRRLPAATVRAFSPLGDAHPVTLAGGNISEALGRWTGARAAELADELDFIAIGGGEIIHTHDEFYGIWYDDIPREQLAGLKPSDYFIDGVGRDLEYRCPTAWHAVGIPFDFDDDEAARVRAALADRRYVSVRDPLSRDRLIRAGVEREIHVVPDSAFVLDRILPRDLLAKRIAYLRATCAYPIDVPPLIVQGSSALMSFADEIGSALRRVLREHESPPVVLLETGPCHGDAGFADAIAPHLEDRPYRVGAESTVEDIAAAISHSRGFVGLSLHGSITAFVYGLPSAILNLVGYSKLDALAGQIGHDALVTSVDDLDAALGRVAAGVRANGDRAAFEARVDDHFDALAELAEVAAWERGAPLDAGMASGTVSGSSVHEAVRRYEALRRAHAARGRRLVEERHKLAELLRQAESRTALVDLESRTALADLEKRIAELEQRLAEAETARARAIAELAERTAERAAVADMLARLESTKVFRYTAPLRRAYARLRHAR